MKLRIVQIPDDPNTPTVPFGDESGYLLPQWREGTVVMIGNKWAKDHTVVFTNGESHFYSSVDGPFTPRVEEWVDVGVVVLFEQG